MILIIFRRYENVDILEKAKCIPIRLNDTTTNKSVLYISLHHSRNKTQQQLEQKALATFVEREESSPEGFDAVIIGGDTNVKPDVVKKWKPANTSILITKNDPPRLISNIMSEQGMAISLFTGN